MNQAEQFDGVSPKSEVIQGFLNLLNAEMNRLYAEADRSFRVAAEMDGKMQSRYDTQKEEHTLEGNMRFSAAQAIESRIGDYIERGIEDIKTNNISENSVFLLRDSSDGVEEWFFMASFAGGHSLVVRGTRIVGLNPASPLGRNATGKCVGEKISYEINGEHQEFKILNII